MKSVSIDYHKSFLDSLYSPEIERLDETFTKLERAEAERKLRSKLGADFSTFLHTPQPEFQDKTGLEILETIPHLIVKRLLEIEREENHDE